MNIILGKNNSNNIDVSNKKITKNKDFLNINKKKNKLKLVGELVKSDDKNKLPTQPFINQPPPRLSKSGTSTNLRHLK